MNIVYIFLSLPELCPTFCLNLSVDNMTEVSSLHDGLDPRGRGGRSQPPALSTVYDRDEAMSTISSVSQQGHRRGGNMGNRMRARSMDNLDDIGRRHDRDNYPPYRRGDEPWGRRGWVEIGSPTFWNPRAASWVLGHTKVYHFSPVPWFIMFFEPLIIYYYQWHYL